MKPQRLIKICLTLPLLLAMTAIIGSAQAEVVVIVSAKSPITSLTAEQTARIFLGKTSTFPDNSAATPIDQREGSAIRDEFYNKVVHKTPSQVAAYWAKIIFTGDGRPPDMLDSDGAVRRAVAKDPGAIGYIDRQSVNRTVRVILEP